MPGEVPTRARGAGLRPFAGWGTGGCSRELPARDAREARGASVLSGRGGLDRGARHTGDKRPVTQPRGKGERRRREALRARARPGSREREARGRSHGGARNPGARRGRGPRPRAVCPAPRSGVLRRLPGCEPRGGEPSSRAATRARGAQVPATRLGPGPAQPRGGLAPARAPGAVGGSRARRAPRRGGRERRGEAPAAGTGRVGRGPYSRGGGGGPVNLNDCNLACLRR